MTTEYPKILDSREQSTMVSNWTEYFWLSKSGKDSALLEICQYEALGQQTYDDEGVPEEPPDEIDGKEVVGVEDGTIIGGDLRCWNDSFHFAKQTLPDAIEWLGDNWNISNELLDEVAKAVGASTSKTGTAPSHDSLPIGEEQMDEHDKLEALIKILLARRDTVRKDSAEYKMISRQIMGLGSDRSKDW